jgi:arsenite/tail-anchored protein-transporting ATPase
MTQFIFFSGKGGVGKTTMASATAVYYAQQGKKTLIVTTDPASNLADVFEQEIGHKVTALQGIENLFGMEIEPDAATREYKERIIGPFRAYMPEDIIASLEEQFNSPCTTEIASFDRFVDFMDTDEYDIIVFDTAPTGHTVRLLELPVDWSRHIEESAKGGGHTCLGPVQAIQSSKEKYDRATSLLRDLTRTTFVFVMRPEELSLYETMRAAKELASIGIQPGQIIINGILPVEVCEIAFFQRKYASQRQVIQETEDKVSAEKRYMFLRDTEVKGLDDLRNVARELYHNQKPEAAVNLNAVVYPDITLTKPDMNKLLLPNGKKKLVFFTGKGGVGKTTISCITALYASEKGFKTLLVTTDPAAHIGEVLDKKVGSVPTQITDKLCAVMIDPQDAFAEYKERVLSEARGKYSPDMLAAMEEELNSPCTEEMASFDKFTYYIETAEYEVVVFDTAPTGHTLRLLDLPFDYAKQVEMMVSMAEESVAVKQTSQQRFKSIIEKLRDPVQTCFALVLYPESTPVVESYRAMLDLREAGIDTQLVVANMVLPEEVCTNQFFKNRRSMQLKYLNKIEERFNLPVLVYPLLDEDVRGIEHLKMASVYF